MSVDTVDTTVVEGSDDGGVVEGSQATPAASYDDIVASLNDENFGQEIPDVQDDTPPEGGEPGDDESQAGKQDSEEKKEEGEVSKADEPKKEGKDGKSESKQLTAKTSDGKEITIPEDATFTKTVDGEEREVSVADALQAYAFDTNYTKKYQELSKQKEETEAEKTKAQHISKKAQETLTIVGDALKDTVQSIQGGDIEGFLKKFSSMTKVSPSLINSAFRKHYIPTLEKYLNATDEERAAMDAAEKEAHSNEEIEALKREKTNNEQLNSYKQYAVSQIQKSGISSEEWEAAETRLINDYLDGNTVDFLKVTPQEVKQYIDTVIVLAQDGKQSVATSSLMEKAAPGLAEKDKEKYDEVVKTISPFLAEFSEDELITIVQDVLGEKSDPEEGQKKEDTSDKTAGDKVADSATPQESNSQLNPEDEDYNPLSVYDVM